MAESSAMRAEARKKRDRLERQIDEKMRAAGRLIQRCHALRLQVIRLERKLAMTDEELAAEKARRQAAAAKGKARRVRRRLTLREGLL